MQFDQIAVIGRYLVFANIDGSEILAYGLDNCGFDIGCRHAGHFAGLFAALPQKRL